LVYALFTRYIDENNIKKNQALLIELNEVLEISNLLDWEENSTSGVYSYANHNDWINEIEDEDDRYEIAGWQRRVEKGKMTEEEFEEKLRELLSDNK